MLNSLDKESTIAMFSILCTMLFLAILINWAHVCMNTTYILINVGILDIKNCFYIAHIKVLNMYGK